MSEPGECGTYGGYKRHLRRREPRCGPCRRANRDAKARWISDGGAQSDGNRDVRNNLPETPGYQWRARRYPWAVEVLARAEAAWGRPEDEEAA